MNKMKAWQGSYGVSKYTGIVSPAYFVFDFNYDMNPDYFHYAIRSRVYVSFFGQASDGIRVGQWDLSIQRMKEIPFYLPHRSEQDQIVRFLDWKVSNINKLINIKKKEINKSFNVGKNDILQVDNRYGNITVTHWSKSEVSIRVVIEAKAATRKRHRTSSTVSTYGWKRWAIRFLPLPV